ncbi:MAG TPA: ArsA family ATPase [Paenalcaligenes sp.]|nr:ArsA family ATPase [Paenalcaligenes sp.]
MATDISRALAHKRVLLIGGKGGVGKTTVSSSLAVHAAQQGRKVLLVSTDPAHSLSDIFARTIGPQEVHVSPNLYVCEIDPEKEVDAYLDRVLNQMRRYAGYDQVHELQRHLRLSRSSPGAQEAALLERISQLLDSGLAHYDLIIFDTAPTGHTLRLLSLPEVIAAWTDGLLRHNQRSEQLGKVLAHLTPGRDVDNVLKGPENPTTAGLDDKSQELAKTLQARQSLFHRTRRLLHDKEKTAFYFVMTPERLPVLETARAVEALGEVGVNVQGVIINRILPESIDQGFWRQHQLRQQEYMAEIEQRFAGLEQYKLYLQEDEIIGLERLQALSDALIDAGPMNS